jgi:zinc transport system ATP-binding protein
MSTCSMPLASPTTFGKPPFRLVTTAIPCLVYADGEIARTIMVDREDRVTGVDEVLEVRHLSIRFGETRVVTDLSFRVGRGTSLAIIGPNGSGKTVLFKALIGSVPFEGDVRWAPGIRIGYVPQKLDLERDVPVTGLDLLRARATLARESDANASRALGLVDVSQDVAGQPIGTLSGGQFQRLLVAFALVGDPTVLLLDEPTAGVDEPGQARLNELVHRLQRDEGLTVLFISHELTVVYRYATRVLCLSRGRGCSGPPRAILTPELLHEMYGTPVDHHVHSD